MKYLSGVLLVLTVCFSQAQEKTLSRPDIPGDIMVDIGLNFWSDIPGQMDQREWPSKSLGIYYTTRKVISNKFSYSYGVGLNFEKIAFGTNALRFVPLVTDTLGVTSFTEEITSTNRLLFKKYKLAILYMDIPLELRFHPKGTQDGEGFFVGAGGILGLRLNSYDKLITELNGDKMKSKNVNDFGLNSFRYGLQFRLGFKGVHFFYKRYYQNMFKNDISVLDAANPTLDDPAATFNPTMSTFGINLTGF
ncbi:MAG: outer membrane beta-barrel protein [Cyclobacteriaceae bacterium]